MKEQRRVIACEKLEQRSGGLVERKEERTVVKQEPEVERELLIQPLK